MAKLIYSGIMSLDGYIADRAGKFDWSEPDEEAHALINDWTVDPVSRASCVEPHQRATTWELLGDKNWSSVVHFDPGSGRVMVGTFQVTRRPRFMVSLFESLNGRTVQTSTLDAGNRWWGLLGFVGSDRLIGTESSPTRLRAWQMSEGRLTSLWDSKMPDGIREFALSSRLIAAAGRSREILFLSTETGRLEAPARRRLGFPRSRSFPMGRLPHQLCTARSNCGTRSPGGYCECSH